MENNFHSMRIQMSVHIWINADDNSPDDNWMNEFIVDLPPKSRINWILNNLTLFKLPCAQVDLLKGHVV